MLSRRRLFTAAAASWAAALFPPQAWAQAAGGAPAWSERARERLMPGDSAGRARLLLERQELLDQGEAALVAGAAQRALETFERAAMMLHAADTELGIVRSQMALGEYRRAVSFASHTAGAHRDQPGGVVIYAWLLHMGGQSVFARRLVDQAIERNPAPLLLQVRQQLIADWPIADAELLQRPWRVAPHGTGVPVPTGARVVATGLLIGRGDEALVPAAVAETGGRFWVRDGLGRTMAAAESAGRAAAPGLWRLPLAAVLHPPRWQPAPREPFAGSPATMIEFAADADGRPGWPISRMGFFAGVPGGPDRPLGLSAPGSARGGPVFDRQGRLAGVATASAAGDRLVPTTAWLDAASGLSDRIASAPAAGAAVADLDRVYEGALGDTLQVLVLR